MEEESGAGMLARRIEELGSGSPRDRHRALAALRRLTGRDFGTDAQAWRGWWRTYAHLRCNRCGRPLYDQKLYYLVKARVTSEPAELSLSAEDLARDHEADIGRLLGEMAGRPATELEDEVFVLLDYYLCLGCKAAYVREVRRGPETGPPD